MRLALKENGWNWLQTVIYQYIICRADDFILHRGNSCSTAIPLPHTKALLGIFGGCPAKAQGKAQLFPLRQQQKIPKCP